MQRAADPRPVVGRKITHLRRGVVEVFGGDGAVGEDEVAGGGEAGEGAAAEVHDDLDEVGEVGVVLELSAHLLGDEDKQAVELIGEVIGGSCGGDLGRKA